MKNPFLFLVAARKSPDSNEGGAFDRSLNIIPKFMTKGCVACTLNIERPRVCFDYHPSLSAELFTKMNRPCVIDKMCVCIGGGGMAKRETKEEESI